MACVNSFVVCYVALSAFPDVLINGLRICFWVSLLVQVIYSDEERRYNGEITVGLIRSELINLSDYNVQLTKLIDGGHNSKLLETLRSAAAFTSFVTCIT